MSTKPSADGPVVYELRDVAVLRSRRTLVADVSMTVHAGEVLAIMGENGAGKSTLLHAMAGDFAPDRGSVRLNGRALDAWSDLEQARQRAVVTQHGSVAFGFPALEVVLFGRSPHDGGRPGARDLAIAHEALARTDAARFATRAYATLSGGERARVMLARAFAQVMRNVDDAVDDAADPIASLPRALLLDEPSAALDVAHQHAAFEAIRLLARSQGIAVAVVLHDPNLAALYADRVALMKDGALTAIGPVDSTLTEEAISACFSMPMRRLAHPTRDVPLLVALPRPVPTMQPIASDDSGSPR